MSLKGKEEYKDLQAKCSSRSAATPSQAALIGPCWEVRKRRFTRAEDPQWVKCTLAVRLRTLLLPKDQARTAVMSSTVGLAVRQPHGPSTTVNVTMLDVC